MADTLKIDSVKMQDILETRVSGYGSDARTNYSSYSEATKRQLAVTAVLEIMKSNPQAMNFSDLRGYADIVLAAMEGE